MTARAIVLAVASVLLAAWSWRDSAVTYAEAYAPQSFGMLLRGEPRLVLAARDRRNPTLPPADRAEAVSVAETARALLRASPLSVSALRQLALAGAGPGQPLGRDGLSLAEAVSRRDTGVQALLIESAARDNDYAAAMIHVDRLLTVVPHRFADLAPSLIALVSLPQGRASLMDYTDRGWFISLMNYGVDRAGSRADVVSLVDRSGIDLSRDESGLLPSVLSVLALRGEGEKARSIARRLGKADLGRLDDFALVPATTDARFQPLTWRLDGNDLASVSLAGPRGLEARVPPGQLIRLARRIMTARPGRHVLTMSALLVDGGPPASVSWKMYCVDNGIQTMAWQQALPVTSTARSARVALEIPVTCGSQVWELWALADDRQTDARIRIDAIALEPAS